MSDEISRITVFAHPVTDGDGRETAYVGLEGVGIFRAEHEDITVAIARAMEDLMMEIERQVTLEIDRYLAARPDACPERHTPPGTEAGR